MVENESLSDFIRTTENITVTYEYPSMRVTSASAESSALPAHTLIVVRCDETIDSTVIKSGSTIYFSVLKDVMDRDGATVLIKAGAPVTAQISFAQSKDILGRSGQIIITDFHLSAIDGTYIPLSGSVSANPDDKMVRSIVLTVLVCPLFLLMKGDDARVPAGTTKTVYTATDNYINTDRI